jgi:multimeric flavodoxin WrbA
METKPRVLFVYYTFSQQTGRVVDAMADSMKARGCEVTKAQLLFTDPGYTLSHETVPMKWAVMKIVAMLPGQARRKTAEIQIPAEAQSGEYDLVVLGGPTWWLTANMPMRSYLKTDGAKAVLNGKPFGGFSVSRRYWRGNVSTMQKMGEAAGGHWLDETHFLAAGNQVKSMLSWLSYMRSGEMKERWFGVKIPPTNLKPDFEEQAHEFSNRLLDLAAQKNASVPS